jgi:hypothetical protein
MKPKYIKIEEPARVGFRMAQMLKRLKARKQESEKCSDGRSSK